MKYTIKILTCLIALLLANPVFSREKLAVMELEALGGVEESLVEIMTNTLKDALDAAGGYSIISREEIEALANRLALQQKSGDCTNTDCLADMGKALGTKLMVYGSISKLGSTYSLSLRLLDTESKEAIRRVNELCKCSEEDLFATVQTAATKIMANNIKLQDANSQLTAGIEEPLPQIAPRKSTRMLKNSEYIEIQSASSGLIWRFMLKKKEIRKIADKICSVFDQEDKIEWRLPARDDFKMLLAEEAFKYSAEMPAKYHTREIFSSNGRTYATWREYAFNYGGTGSSTGSYFDLEKGKAGVTLLRGDEYHVACIQNVKK